MHDVDILAKLNAMPEEDRMRAMSPNMIISRPRGSASAEPEPDSWRPDLPIRAINGKWVADFSKTAQARIVYELFGSVLIPTPYSCRLPIEYVRKQIQANNPEHKVVMISGNGGSPK